MAPLVGVGGLTKTGCGTVTYRQDVLKYTGPTVVREGRFVVEKGIGIASSRLEADEWTCESCDVAATREGLS